MVYCPLIWPITRSAGGRETSAQGIGGREEGQVALLQLERPPSSLVACSDRSTAPARSTSMRLATTAPAPIIINPRARALLLLASPAPSAAAAPPPPPAPLFGPPSPPATPLAD
jgi:hypothetical protein